MAIGTALVHYRRSYWATSPGCQAARVPCLAVGFSTFNIGYQQQLPASDTEQNARMMIVRRPGLVTNVCRISFALMHNALLLSM